MKRSTGTLLLTMVALLAGSLYVLNRPAERGMQRLRFAKLAYTGIDRIEMSGAHKAALHKDGSTWKLTNGRKADAGMVERLLTELLELESTEWLTDEPADFDDLEVTGPKATDVRLESKGRVLLGFSVGGGGHEPGKEPRLLYKQQVWQVGHALASLVQTNEDAWLDRGVLPMAEQDVMAVTVAGPQGDGFTLRRGVDGAGWQMEPPATGLPKGYRFDPAQAESFVNVLMGMRLQQFVDLDPGAEKTGLTPALAERWTVVGAGESPATATLWIGKTNEQGDRYARIEGQGDVFTLMDGQVQGMRRSRDDFRALNLMASVDFDQVVAGGVERRGEAPMHFTRANDQWSLKSGKGLASFAVDPVKVNQRLRKMTLSRAIGVAKAGEGKMQPESGRLWLKLKDGTQLALRIGAKATPSVHGTPGFWARGTADDSVYRMSKPLADELLGGPGTLQKASATANKPAMPSGDGLDSLPPDVRAKIQQQMAAQGQAG